MELLMFGAGAVVGIIMTVFVMCREISRDFNFRCKIQDVYTSAYRMWMYYIANGVNNASNETISYLLEDLGKVTKMLADELNMPDATLNYYVGQVNKDEH